MTADRAVDAAGQTQDDNPNRHLGPALLVICSAQLMIVLDIFIVNVSIPTIHADLHFSTSSLEWLVTAYSLTFGGLLLLGGRAGDLYGKRRMFLIGVTVFTLSSLLAGLAVGAVWLIIARGLQGVGAAIAAPTALSLIATNFAEGRERNHAMGVYAMMSAGGGAVGLLLGGVLTNYVSWRWIFIVNVPIGALVLVLAPRALHEARTTPGRLDVPGAVAATAAMLALVYGLSNASNSWSSARTVIPLAVAVALFATFVIIESRSPAPLVPPTIFADRNRVASYAIMLCVAVAIFSMYFFLTQFLQNVLGWSAVKTGVGFLPAMVSVSIAAAFTSRVLVKRVGLRVPLITGMAVIVIGLGWISRISVSSRYLDALGPLILIEVGIGFSIVSITLATVSGVQGHETGLASALLNCMQQAGGALGLAVLSTIAIHAANNKVANLAGPGGQLSARSTAIATTHGYAVAFLVGAAIALAGVIISIVGIHAPPRPSDPGQH